jgi:hypothetical protein
MEKKIDEDVRKQFDTAMALAYLKGALIYEHTRRIISLM